MKELLDYIDSAPLGDLAFLILVVVGFWKLSKAIGRML